MKKTVLITGCSSGFGKACATLFLHNGWNVIASMRKPEIAAEWHGNDNVLVTRLDVQDQGSVQEAIHSGIKRFGKIDAVINNAGYGLFGIFEETPSEKILEQFEVNVFGVMNVTRAVLPHMRANGGGTILNISSGAGAFALPMISLYCASKFALEGFSEALSYELASQNIIVKIIEPGGVISTEFGSRSSKEAASSVPIDSYADFTADAMAVFAGLREQRLATEQEVADVIYRAATDGTNQLRYIATEDIKPLVAARRETSEAAYLALMRERFGYRLPHKNV